MAAGTNSIRRVGVSQDKSPGVTPPSRSINPVGNRTLQPTMQRAPRRPKHDGRSYMKGVPTGGMFDLPGYNGDPQE